MNRRLIVIAALLMIALLAACGGAEEPLPTLAELPSEATNTSVPTTPIPTVGVLAQTDFTPTRETVPTDTEVPPTDTDVPPTATDVPETATETATNSPTPVDISMENEAETGQDINVALPNGWSIEAGNMLVRNEDVQTSATVVVVFSDEFAGLTLEEIALELEEDDETVTIEETESNERSIIIMTKSDSGFETVTYLVNDSDGDAIGFFIQPFVEDKDALADDVLFMAGIIEVE